MELWQREPHEGAHFFKLVPEFFTEFLDVTSKPCVSFCDLMNVAPQGFCEQKGSGVFMRCVLTGMPACRSRRELSGSFRAFLELPFCGGHDVVRREPELLLEFFEGRRGAECFHADDLAGQPRISRPPKG